MIYHLILASSENHAREIKDYIGTPHAVVTGYMNVNDSLQDALGIVDAFIFPGSNHCVHYEELKSRANVLLMELFDGNLLRINLVDKKAEVIPFKVSTPMFIGTPQGFVEQNASIKDYVFAKYTLTDADNPDWQAVRLMEELIVGSRFKTTSKISIPPQHPSSDVHTSVCFESEFILAISNVIFKARKFILEFLCFNNNTPSVLAHVRECTKEILLLTELFLIGYKVKFSLDITDEEYGELILKIQAFIENNINDESFEQKFTALFTSLKIS